VRLVSKVYCIPEAAQLFFVVEVAVVLAELFVCRQKLVGVGSFVYMSVLVIAKVVAESARA
jgi:hypothetical protein